jgi:hypothetical protein
MQTQRNPFHGFVTRFVRNFFDGPGIHFKDHLVFTKEKISSKNFLGQNECHSASYKTSVIYYFFCFGRINFIKTQKSNYEII